MARMPAAVYELLRIWLIDVPIVNMSAHELLYHGYVLAQLMQLARSAHAIWVRL